MNKTRLLILALLTTLILAACANEPAPAGEPFVETVVVEATAVPVESAPVPTDEPGVEEVAVEEMVEETAVTQTDIATVDEEGNTDIDQTALTATLAANPVEELSQAEIASILFMREEEKLAHDVYITLYEQWGLNIFQNIANSEQTHTDAVLTLINRFGLQDPVGTNGVGVFANQDLQALYDQLTAQGSESIANALKVGGAIEEIDILDLEESIGATSNTDIITVYESLLKGSRNHLRAFVSTLAQQTGDVYEPGYLSQEAYDAIILADIESGGGGNGQGGSGQGGNGKRNERGGNN